MRDAIFELVVVRAATSAVTRRPVIARPLRSGELACYYVYTRTAAPSLVYS